MAAVSTPYSIVTENNMVLIKNETISAKGMVNDTMEVDDLIDLREFQVKYSRVHGYISVFVCLIGILANIANIVVFTRKNMTTTINVLFTWLAVADLLTMLDYLPFAMHFYIVKDPDLVFPETRGFGWICYLLFHANFSVFCHSSAIWLTITLATFRFVGIWFPIKGRLFCTITRARQFVAIIFVTVIVLCIPNCIVTHYGVIVFNVTSGNFTTATTDVIFSVDRRVGSGFDSLEKVNRMIYSIVFKILPCFLLAVLTILLIVGMRKAYKTRTSLINQPSRQREDSDRHGEHNRVTGMLLAVVLLFLFAELPLGILTLLSMVEQSFFVDVYLPLGDIFDMLVLVNSALNIVFYCTMSRKFRETFVATFCRPCPKTRSFMEINIVE